MKNTILLIAIAALFSGCATTSYYTPVTADKKALPKVSGFDERKGLTEWKKHQIIAIDDGAVKYPFGIWSVYRYKIPVDPGRHVFVVQSEFNRGGFFGGGPWRSVGEVVCFIENGREYQLNSDFHGSKIRLWFEDAKTGEVLSDVSEEVFEKSPQNHYVPIIIPSG